MLSPYPTSPLMPPPSPRPVRPIVVGNMQIAVQWPPSLESQKSTFQRQRRPLGVAHPGRHSPPYWGHKNVRDWEWRNLCGETCIAVQEHA